MLSQEVQGALTHPYSIMTLSNSVWTLSDLNAFRILELSSKYVKSHCRISDRNMNNIFPSLYMKKLISNKGQCVLSTHKCHKTKRIVKTMQTRQ